jgi:DNA-binding transcriptional MerR regulator
MTGMKIGELAKKTGKTVRALHLYEELGLLAPRRSGGGFRLYGPDELARVEWIVKLQDMGFKLAQIRELLATVHAASRAPEAMEEVRALFEGKLAQTREQATRLRRLERDILDSLAYLEACRTCPEHSAVACADCHEDHQGLRSPELVTGIHLGRRVDRSRAPIDAAE